MINQIMKISAIKACCKDLEKNDYSKLSQEVIEDKDLSYVNGGTEEHKLDVYYKVSEKLNPILVDIHGGGFISGDKENNHLFGNYMAQKGFTVFNINYRLAYPKYNVFDQVTDLDNALKWIIKNSGKYNGDKNAIYISGHSSAGVLAVIEALLCKSESLAMDFNIGMRDYEYKGVLLDCGLMHFYKSSIAYWGMRGMVFPKGYKKTKQYKDIIFENNQDLYKLPKTVLLTNSKDELRAMTYYFKHLLDKVKVQSKMIDQGNDGHMGIIFRPYTKDNSLLIDEIVDFFNN